MKSDEILDCYGLMCPMPIFKTASKIKEIEVGKVLEIIATDEGIKKTSPPGATPPETNFFPLRKRMGRYTSSSGGFGLVRITLIIVFSAPSAP